MSKEYYETLGALNTPTTLSGRVTAQLEMASPGKFEPNSKEIYGREGFSKKVEAVGYDVVVDTKGMLLWPDQTGNEKPVLIITSEQVTREYLSYLDEKNISWIVCGKEKIDLVRAAVRSTPVFWQRGFWMKLVSCWLPVLMEGKE